MAIDYKTAYRELQKAYKALLTERIGTANLPLLIDWINNPNRKPAVTSFTEGPERQIAYHVEDALRLERETTAVIPPLTLRPTERCPRCSYTQTVHNYRDISSPVY